MDWTNLEELEAHASLLDRHDLSCLDFIHLKLNARTPGVAYDNRLTSTALILGMSGHPRGRRACACGIRTPRNWTGRCENWRFCPPCAERKRLAAIRTFYPRYGRGVWYMMTIAFDEFLALDLGGREGVRRARAQVLARWDACGLTVAEMVKAKEVRGSYGTEALEPIHFAPVRVQAHHHAVLHADTPLTDGFADRVCEAVQEKLSAGEEKAPVASVRLVAIRDRYHFSTALRYIAKPIHLLDAYEMTWRREGVKPREIAPRLNGDVASFIAFLCNLTEGRRQPLRRGAMNHAARRNFIGVRRRDWGDLRGIRAEIHEAAAARPEDSDPFDDPGDLDEPADDLEPFDDPAISMSAPLNPAMTAVALPAADSQPQLQPAEP